MTLTEVSTLTKKGKMVALGALLIVVGLAGCGGDASNSVAVRVDGAPIQESTVERWARAIKREGGAGMSDGSAREHALAVLISSHWLIGEAAARRLGVSGREVQRRLRAQGGATLDRRNKLNHQLASTLLTSADLEFEIGAEIAGEKLREALVKRAAPVAPTAVAAYFRDHLDRFRVRQRRLVDLIEGIPSRSVAIELRRLVGTGRAFRRRAVREIVQRPERLEAETQPRDALSRAIFTSRPGVVAPPFEYKDAWVLILVRREMPAYIEGLSKKRSMIVQLLRDKQQNEALDRFVKIFKERWTAKTSCRTGFVVQKCAQYAGPKMQERDPFDLAP
jgi:foldase protein PrsA